jgi:hypothetical protein
MELKNAVAVCLVSLCSATLVVLIARSLDSQAAARLEPQLERIAQELQAIREAGGIAPLSGSATKGESVDDGLMVYYFHGNVRCPTCRSIESQSYDTVKAEFDSELANGAVVWKTLNYEEPSNAELAKRFEIQMPVVVLAQMKDGRIADWKRLDQVWAVVGDKSAFREYVRGEIAAMLKDNQPPVSATGSAASESHPADLPLPTGPSDTPVPE